MGKCAKEYVAKALAPSLLVSASRAKRASRPLIRAVKIMGRPAKAELFIAFDDPYSWVGLDLLEDVLRGRNVDLRIYPVTERGISGDPDREDRLSYSIVDAARIAARHSKTMQRKDPVKPETAAMAARLAESCRGAEMMMEVCLRFLKALWEKNEEVGEADLFSIHREVTGQDASLQTDAMDRRLEQNRELMLKKGHWETPAILVLGQWYFAHERADRIGGWLDRAGWRNR